MPNTIELPVQTRAAAFVPNSVNADARTIELVWSTGAPVSRTDWRSGDRYNEALSLEPGQVDLSRLNAGAPFLNTHSASDLSSIIGVVDRAWVADGGNGLEGRAVVRFSDRADVTPFWNDICTGIIRNVSVGYAVRTYQITSQDGQVDEWRAIDWLPLELSAVPIGADPGAGFRAAGRSFPCQINRKEIPTPASPSPPPRSRRKKSAPPNPLRRRLPPLFLSLRLSRPARSSLRLLP